MVHSFIWSSIVVIMMTLSMSVWSDEVTTNEQNLNAVPLETPNHNNNGDLKSSDNAAKSEPATAPDPEDEAYKAAMIQLSNAIDQKIAEIKAKQTELDSEIYPAYQPPLRAELKVLQQQLQELNMQREQLKAQKTSRDMTKELKPDQ